MISVEHRVKEDYCSVDGCFNLIASPSRRTVDDRIKEFMCNDEPVCSECAPTIDSCPKCFTSNVKDITPRTTPQADNAEIVIAANNTATKIAADKTHPINGLKKSNKIKKCLKIAATIASLAAIVFALLLLL